MELYIKDEGIKDRSKYSHSPKLNNNFIRDVLKQVFVKVDRMMDKFHNTFPSPASKNLLYEKTENTQWTSSFFTGMLWLSYEISKDTRYKELAEKHIESFRQRLYNKMHIDTHDLGFLYTLSCVSAYKLTKNEDAKKIATDAARYLSSRYWEKAGIIQAWGKMDDKDERGRIIIDCMMNLPLLYWAWETTGDKRFFEIAYNHAQKTAENIVRSDASTYHTFYFDVDTGKPLFGKTHQGYSDDSCWARGQAWGIYGFVLSYTYTKKREFIEVAKRLLNYYLNQALLGTFIEPDKYFEKVKEVSLSQVVEIAQRFEIDTVYFLRSRGVE